jgi:NAD(P)-dependent dehydrogenase (short-subunit alcohol dehydrogenase family)
MRDGGIEGSVVLMMGIPTSGDRTTHAFLEAETTSMAAEYAPNAIRVNAVAVGHVEVGRRGHSVSSGASLLGHKAVHPIEVGKAVWFLLNPNLSSGLTGATLKIDRGASLTLPDW